MPPPLPPPFEKTKQKNTRLSYIPLDSISCLIIIIIFFYLKAAAAAGEKANSSSFLQIHLDKRITSFAKSALKKLHFEDTL